MKKDRLIGLISLLLGGIAFALTMMIQTSASSASAAEPGPKLFPMSASVILIACGLGLMLQKQKDYDAYLTKEQVKRLGILFGVFVLYCVGLHFLGFVIATPILLFITMTMFAGKKELSLIVRLIYSIGLTAVIYLTFVVALKTNIPAGLLFGLF